ncbi:MAG: HAMP domain-containing sensor histidine kinase, partial [Croceibacterium sp.]
MMLSDPLLPASPRSIFERLVHGAILFTLLAIALLFAVTLAESWHATRRSLAAAVDTDVAGLVDIFASGGEAELVRRLDDRTALVSIEGRSAHYLLRRPQGQALTGNVARWPAPANGLSPILSEQGFLTLPDGTPVFARATRLGPQLDLLVARSYDRDRAAMWRLAALFMVAATGIVLAVWLIGRRAAQRLQERLGQINTALLAAEQGAHHALPQDQPHDEIGQLALSSSRAIARAASLAATHRHMSDHIAHEIRTPLTHLENRLVATLRALPPDADGSGLERCRQDIRNTVSMLDSLLDIAASESRVGDRSGLAVVDLSAMASDLVELYSGSAEDAGVTLRSFIEPGVAVMGERMQLTRLVSNLLDNALKHVPRGGTISLRLASGPVIEVADDGPGVAPALRP